MDLGHKRASDEECRNKEHNSILIVSLKYFKFFRQVIKLWRASEY